MDFWTNWRLGHTTVHTQCEYNEKQNKYHTFPKIQWIIDTLNIYDQPVSWLGTGYILKSSEVKLVLSAQASPLSEIIERIKAWTMEKKMG